MADDVTVDVDAKKLALAMKRVPRQLYLNLRKRLGGGRGYLHKWVRREIADRKMDGSPLHSRSLMMRRSFDSAMHGASLKSLRFITGAIKPALPYPVIHEFGGTIRPKRGKFLWMPLAGNKNASGLVRVPPSDLFDADGLKAGYRFVKTRRGPMVVKIQKTRSTPMFLLLKEVKIPARLGFFKAWEKQMPALMKQFDLAIDEALMHGEKA